MCQTRISSIKTRRKHSENHARLLMLLNLDRRYFSYVRLMLPIGDTELDRGGCRLVEGISFDDSISEILSG